LYSHEAKHFHDLLVTPYGSMLMRQYINASIHFLVARAGLYYHKTVVVPLSDWILNYDLLSSIYPNLSKPCELLIEAEEVLDGVQRKVNAFGHPQGSINGKRLPSADVILEGMACLIHERVIEENFGSSMAKEFIETLENSSTARKYLEAPFYLKNLLGEGLTWDVISYILLASLYGNFQDPSPARVRRPPDILQNILIYLIECQFDLRKAGIDDVVKIVNTYFNQHQGGSLLQMVEIAHAANEKVYIELSNSLDRYEKTWGIDQNQARIVLEMFADFNKAQKILGSAVATHPQWYCSDIYLANQFALPKPPVLLYTEKGLPLLKEISFFIETIFNIEYEETIKIPLIVLDRNPLTKAQKESFLRVNPINKDDIFELRFAHLLTLRMDHGSKENIVNASLWREALTLTSGLRLLMEGPGKGMSDYFVRQTVAALNVLGIQVCTVSGPIDVPKANISSDIMKRFTSSTIN